MKIRLTSILFLVTFVSMMHVSGLFHFSQMFDHANATRVSQERVSHILWAHAGMSDPPDVISRMFDRHKNLWVDISIREHEIAPNEKLSPERLFDR